MLNPSFLLLLPVPPKSVPKPKGIRYPKTKSKKTTRPSPPPDRASLRLLARTSPTPLKPERIDSEATKHLGAVRGHKLNTIWDDTVAPKVYAFLDEMGLKWSVVQIIHYMELGEPCGPASLCIGVRPKSLADEDANAAAFRCLDLLKEFDITDIDVQIGEAITWD